MRLDGKVCFVTGGASGMGRLAASMFCAEGASVAVADVNVEACETAAAEARRGAVGGGDAFAVPCDVTREAEVRQAIAAAVERYGGLHVLYNNAGIMMAEDRSVVDTEEWVWDRTLGVNLKGIYLCCKHGIPELMRSGGGSVVNIASFVALLGCSVPQDAYTASKGAVIALTKSLAVQLRRGACAATRSARARSRPRCSRSGCSPIPRRAESAWPGIPPGVSEGRKTS
jgi:NAD(P)-dependent dehydrogenase (short-subunit alcohol dehydrogenase family)